MALKQQLREGAKFLVRQTVGRIPPSRSRLDGRLAIEGGTPVRNERLRPWMKVHGNSLGDWMSGGGSMLRSVFLSGKEGVPGLLAKRFAAEWASYCGCRFGLLLPHGTDALRIGLAAALDHDGLDYGGEVIVPNFSFIASINSILDRRCGVALVDVDPGTLLVDPVKVEEAIIPGKTRAIMPVHLFGQPANMTALRDIATRHNLKLIEDAAQAHGSVWETGPSGSLGDVAGFSFQSFKNIHSGEGGALTTNDEAIFERAYQMHNVGRARIDPERWGHHILGWNCRPTEYQAALLLHRFRSFETEQELRRRNFFALRERLADVRCLQLQVVEPGVRKHGVHMLAMRYDAKLCGDLPVDDFLVAVRAEGIPIYRGYETTMSEQPALKKLIQKRPEYLRIMPTPVSDLAVKQLIYIPQETFLATLRDMEEIACAIHKVEARYAR